jgi:GNAT superfamily N-acetyltransferase
MVSGVTVRRVRVGEAEKIRTARLALLREEEWRGRLRLEEERLSDDEWATRTERGAHSETFATFAALFGDDWIGLADGHFIDATHVDVAGMWVHPAKRSRGIGQMLLDAVGQWAEAQGATRLGLWVVATNDPAKRLCERGGFIPIGAARESALVAGLLVQRMELRG